MMNRHPSALATAGLSVVLSLGLAGGVSGCAEDGRPGDRAHRKNGERAVLAKRDAAPAETVPQENARESAERYLGSSAYSRTRLIQQLRFEGFSRQNAIYAVEAQDVDWKKEAAATAEQYLTVGSFSRKSLLEQLRFEGFTAEQAEYAVEENGF